MLDERNTLLAGAFSRRSVLRGLSLGASGVAAAALLGCGGDDDNEPSGGSGDSSGSGGGATTANLKTTDPRPDKVPAGWDWNEGAPFPADYPEPAVALRAISSAHGCRTDCTWSSRCLPPDRG